ncbi:MAG: adenylate/guanylate cyclase domain-containing protein [Candidatus Binataceae bacterium]
MKCPACGAENPAEQKFCNECAAPFKRRCAKCGYENAPTAKFCGDCAAPLTSNPSKSSAPAQPLLSVHVALDSVSPETLEGERKTVTALFADIKGSTELEQDLDPEEARAIVDPALKLMIDAVRRYDGYIVQSTGDGIFALFGAPVAHEDHPQRALYAALRMQEELRRYSDKLLADGRAPLEIRVGVNTGEVVVRSISTGGGHVEYTPIGHTTNLASRMQTVAPTGSIAITEHTRRLVEGYFALKARGPMRVKGVSEPMNVYEVTGLGPLRTRLQRSAGRGLSRFVGRHLELNAIKHAEEQARAGHGQLVAAIAEAGNGKSRLFFEFRARNQSGWMVLETFSVSHGKASAYLPVMQILLGYFDIEGGDDPRKRREKVSGRIAVLDHALEDTLPYLLGLLGIVEGNDPLSGMDAQVRKRRTLDAIKRILVRESLNQPLMLIFEDLHWIDEETQGLLNLLADSIANARILLLTNYRPEYSHDWSSKTYYTQLRLDPLGMESADEMLTGMLGDGAALAPLKRLIVEKTGGNPFFMEETVQVLCDDGALVREGSATRLTRALGELKIPPTVRAILAARIDRLPAGEKELLQTLAVIGTEFALSLVRRMVNTTNDDELEQMLGDLQTTEFIYEQPAPGDVEYTFKHALTQEVAYNSLLIERRKHLHERAAQALEAMFAGQLEHHLEQLAHHYGHSNNGAKAAEYLGRAGQQALQRFAYADAIVRLTAAIELIKKLPDSAERIQRELFLQLALGPALMALRGYAAVEFEHAYTRALDLCDQLEDNSTRFSVLYGLWSFYLVEAQLEKSREISKQLLDLALGSQDPGLLIEAHWALGCSLFWMGELTSASRQLTQSLELYEPNMHQALSIRYGQDPEVSCLCYLAFILWQRGFPDQARAHGDKAVARARELAHPYDEAFALGLTSMLHQLRGEVGVTDERAERARALSAEQGFQFWEGVGMLMRGWAKREKPEEALTMANQGLRMYQEIGSRVGRTWLLALVSETACRAGDRSVGLDTLNTALSAMTKTEERCYEAELYRLRGELALIESGAIQNNGPRLPSANSQTEAEADFLTAINIARRQQAKSWELRAAMSLSRLRKAQGKNGEAHELLSEVYNWFTEGFDTRDLKDANALLASLRS